MTPMSRPLPRPIGRKKFRSEEARPLAKPKDHPGRIAAVGGLVLLAAVLLGYSMARTQLPDYTSSKAVAVTPVREIVERDDNWIEQIQADPSAGGERVSRLLQQNPNLRPAHVEHNTGIIRFNKRVLENVPPSAGADPKALPRETETGTALMPALETSAPAGEIPKE